MIRKFRLFKKEISLIILCITICFTGCSFIDDTKELGDFAAEKVNSAQDYISEHKNEVLSAFHNATGKSIDIINFLNGYDPDTYVCSGNPILQEGEIINKGNYYIFGNENNGYIKINCASDIKIIDKTSLYKNNSVACQSDGGHIFSLTSNTDGIAKNLLDLYVYYKDLYGEDNIESMVFDCDTYGYSKITSKENVYISNSYLMYVTDEPEYSLAIIMELTNGYTVIIQEQDSVFNAPSSATCDYESFEFNIDDIDISSDTVEVEDYDIDHYVNEYVYADVDDSLILREGPSTDYEQILKIQNGEAMYAYYAVVNFRGYCWYYVDYNGVQGYVLSKYTTN